MCEDGVSKRVVIVHGLEANPHDNWFPWLKSKLEEEQYQVFIPAMPHSNRPKVSEWIEHLQMVVGVPDEETYFVGHSLGCLAIVLFLQTLQKNQKVGACIFVAGFSGNIKNPVTLPFHEHFLDIQEVRSHTDQFVCIFSKDDPRVPLNIASSFAKQLGAKIVIEENKGHFRESDGVRELPVVLNEILSY